MNNRATPYLVGLPNLGVGLLWAMNMTVIPVLVATYTDSSFKTGALISMGAFTGIFVQYLAGLLSDRSKSKMGRRKPFMIGGTLAACLFLCLMPFMPNYTWAFVAAFGFYFSLNFYQGPYFSLIAEAVPPSQLGLANGVARVVSVLGAGVIFVSGIHLWRMHRALPFVLGAGLALVTIGVVVFLIKEKTENTPRPQRVSFDFGKFPAVLQLFAAVFIIYLGMGSITPFFVKYCTDILKLDQMVANNGLLTLTIAGAAMAYPVGKLSDKVERRLVMLGGAAVFALALACGTLITGGPGLYAYMAFAGIGFITVQITAFSILAEIVPPSRLGEFTGAMNLFISLPQFMANNIMGLALEQFGFRIYLPVSAALMALAAVVIAFSRFQKWVEPAQETEVEVVRKAA